MKSTATIVESSDKAKVGQYYKSDGGNVYVIVCFTLNDNKTVQYGLFNILSGSLYTCLSDNVQDVFGKDKDCFTLIPENNTIKINVKY